MRVEQIISVVKKFSFLSLCLVQYCAVKYVSGMAITYDIPQSSMECLYERLDADEYATMSVFITSGAGKCEWKNIWSTVILEDSLKYE